MVSNKEGNVGPQQRPVTARESNGTQGPDKGGSIRLCQRPETMCVCNKMARYEGGIVGLWQRQGTACRNTEMVSNNGGSTDTLCPRRCAQGAVRQCLPSAGLEFSALYKFRF